MKEKKVRGPDLTSRLIINIQLSGLCDADERKENIVN
jgi:hypothetical protein